MKYALVIILDQTIGYLTGDADDYTTEHPKALLLDTREEAEDRMIKYNAAIPTHDALGAPLTDQQREHQETWIEDVADEAEFRAREDTW